MTSVHSSDISLGLLIELVVRFLFYISALCTVKRGFCEKPIPEDRELHYLYLSKCNSNVHCVPGTVTNAEDRAVNKTRTFSIELSL